MIGFWYPVECVLLPCLLGTLMYFGFELWDRRRRRSSPEGHLPVIDYSI